MLKLSSNHQFLLVSFFLLTLVIILNLKIPSQYKLTLIMVGIIICYYQPKFILPFITSIILVFISNKKINNWSYQLNKNKNKKNTTETIETFDASDTKLFLDKMKTITDSNYLSNITTSDIKKLKSGDISLKGVIQKELMKTKFLSNIFDVYFFEYPSDFPLALDLNVTYQSINNLQDAFDFKDITFSKSFKDDKFRDKVVPDLKDKPLHKLGLFVYQTKFLNLKNYFIKNLSNLGLLSLVNGNFTLDNPNLLQKFKLKMVQKKSYEISLLLFFLKYREKDNKFNFNEVLEMEDVSLYDVIPTLVEHQKKAKDDADLAKNSYFLMLPKLLNQINVDLNKYDKSQPKYTLFPNPSIMTKYIIGNKDLGIETLNEDINERSLENNLDLLFQEIENYLENIKILDFKIYRFATGEQRKNTVMSIKSNYFLFLLMQGFMDNLIKKITETRIIDGKTAIAPIYKNLISIYKMKKQQFELQLQNEITIGEEYKFTNLQDKFYDNFFFYLGLFNNETDKFKRILIFPKPSLAPEPSTSDSPTPKNTISDYQQSLYELELDNYIDQEKRKENQEEALNKYYDFLDKEKYEKVENLGKLAEQRNKELKIKELSMNQIIDNFGSEVFNIIDDLTVVFKKFYQDEDLSSFQPGQQENFPSPSPNPSNRTKLDKYISLLKTILDILLQENRILYSGFVLVVLAIFLYFIDSSSPATSNNTPIRSFFDLLKL